MKLIVRAILLGAMLLTVYTPRGMEATAQGSPNITNNQAGSTGLLEAAASSVKTYRVFELALGAASPGNKPYLNGPSVSATFQGVSGAAAGKTIAVQGFWDGGNVWRVRFAPPAAGDWTYTTSSPDSGLNGVTGSLTAVPPTAAEVAANPLMRGFLQQDGHTWKLSDGSPFLPVGDTQWAFSEEFTTVEWERWMAARQAQGFNTFLGNVWMALYDRPEATVHPFPGKRPETDDLQVVFFQRLDHMVQHANDRGIMIGLTIGGFPGNSEWFNRFGTRERNDRWFKYVVARYSAYNVRWVLYAEANEAGTPWGTKWFEEAAHSAQLVKEADPYKHPIGNHHSTVDLCTADNPNIDYIEVQSERTEEQYKDALDLRKYGKPIWFEEYWYEPQMYDGEVALGIRNTHRNFIAGMAFPTMGSLMRAHYPEFDVNQVETDPGAVRMSYFARFYQGLDMRNFSPASNLVNRGVAGKFGGTYAVFLQGGGSVELNLSGARGNFTVKTLDINSGAVAEVVKISGGDVRKIDTGLNSDVAILVIGDGQVSENPGKPVKGSWVFLPVVRTGRISSATSACK